MGRVKVRAGIWDIGYWDLVLQPRRDPGTVGFHCRVLAAAVEAPPAQRATLGARQLFRIFCVLLGQLTLSPFYFSEKSPSSRPLNSHLTSHPFLWCIVHFHLVGLDDLRGIFQP